MLFTLLLICAPILTGQNPVTFGKAVNHPTGLTPQGVVAGDLDGDGDRDLAVANGGNVSVLLNKGNATFAAAVNFATAAGPEAVVADDLDGDGDLDLATANRNAANASVLLNGTANAAAGPTVVPGKPAEIGRVLPVQLTSAPDRALYYLAGFSTGTTPGIPLPGNRVFPLAPTPMLFVSVIPNAVFMNTQGTLGSTGSAYVRLAVPNIAALRGRSVFTAFLVVDRRATTGIGTISPALKITFK
jgi:hypothetical protein